MLSGIYDMMFIASESQSDHIAKDVDATCTSRRYGRLRTGRDLNSTVHGQAQAHCVMTTGLEMILIPAFWPLVDPKDTRRNGIIFKNISAWRS